jgi:hypothetical protein
MRDLIVVPFTEYYMSDEIKKYEDRICSIHGGDEKCIQHYN